MFLDYKRDVTGSQEKMIYLKYDKGFFALLGINHLFLRDSHWQTKTFLHNSELYVIIE